jgi:hypothetical protein
VLFNLEIIGLRDALGRFASMRDKELLEIQMLHAEQLANEFAGLYQGLAPKGQTGNFARSIEATAFPTARGFVVEVQTEMGNVAQWLRQGTGIYGPFHQRIYPKVAKALAFEWLGQHWVLGSVAGMRPNPWEQEADLAAISMGEVMGNRIGVRVVQRLAGQA